MFKPADLYNVRMEKRERLEKTFAGESADRVPVALWRHFPGDDQRAADLARSVVEFQLHYDWDFVNILPGAHFSVLDYGMQDEWKGDPSGRCEIVKHLIERSIDWTDLRPLDPFRGNLGKQLECIQLVCDAFPDSHVPILQTVYNPLTQAGQLSERKLLVQHMRTEPDRLRSGLSTLTQSTLRFIDALKRTKIAGIVYVSELATYRVMSAQEYLEFGVPYDRKILESLPNNWWFNMIQVYGSRPILHLFTEYPVESISWQDRMGHPELGQGKTMFRGAVSGGLAHNEDLQRGTPASIRQAARDAMFETASKRLILSTSGPFPITAPLSNIRATRDVVESIAV